MRMKKILLLLAMTALCVVGGPAIRPVTAEATTLQELIDSDDAPKGIVPDDDYFKLGNDKHIGTNGTTDPNDPSIDGNHAVIVKSADQTKWAAGLSQAEQTLHSEYGSIWSSAHPSSDPKLSGIDPDLNAEPRLDLTKDFKSGMWIYMSANSGQNPGAGMAFVLRAHDKNLSAKNQFENQFYPQKNAVETSQSENLAVWGVDPNDRSQSEQDVADKALKYSWALEFDSEPDTSTLKGADRAFDIDIGDHQHIASNYPTEATTYTKAGATFVPYYKMNHLGVIENNAAETVDSQGIKQGFLTDGHWHHLTLDYKSPASTGKDTGAMTYTFDDKNPANGDKMDPGYPNQQTVEIDLSKLLGGKNVYWGFTATSSTPGTGSQYNSTKFPPRSENAAVIFEQLPGEAEGKADATIYKDGDTTPLKMGDTIDGGQMLRAEYNVDWTRGGDSWKNIKANLALPTNVKPLSGKIEYLNANDQVVSTQDISNIESDNDKVSPFDIAPLGPGKVDADADVDAKADIAQAKQQKAKVVLTAEAQNEDYTSSDKQQHTYFMGSNNMARADLPDLNVKQLPLALTVNSAASTLGINQGNSATVAGTVVPVDKATKNADITLTPTLKGTNGAADTTLPTVKMSNDDPATHFSFDVPSSKLKVGINTISLVATSTSGEKSNPVTFDITVGAVAFGDVSGELNFGTATLTGESQILKPTNDLAVNVIDTQTAAGDWSVYAKAGPMTATNYVGGNLSGHLLYQNSSGQDTTLNNAAVQIATADSPGDGTTDTNLANVWGSNGGIRLDVDGSALSGDYQGNITWELTNAET